MEGAIAGVIRTQQSSDHLSVCAYTTESKSPAQRDCYIAEDRPEHDFTGGTQIRLDIDASKHLARRAQFEKLTSTVTPGASTMNSEILPRSSQTLELRHETLIAALPLGTQGGTPLATRQRSASTQLQVHPYIDFLEQSSE
jgi:hypothetical protein